jgi:hypothetical protein
MAHNAVIIEAAEQRCRRGDGCEMLLKPAFAQILGPCDRFMMTTAKRGPVMLMRWARKKNIRARVRATEKRGEQPQIGGNTEQQWRE